MRKGLLFSLVAACMLFASVETKAQGQSCEEATPWTGMIMFAPPMGPSPAAYPNGAWYKLSITEDSHMTFGLNGYTGNLQIFKSCGGEEVPPFNTSEFILETGNYILKIGTAGQTSIMIMGTVTALSNAPASLLSRLPEGSCCVKPILSTGNVDNFTANVPKWYQYTSGTSQPINITDMLNFTGGAKLTILEARHLDCNATANEANSIAPNSVKVKKGVNLLKLVTDIDVIGTPTAAKFFTIMGQAGYSSCQSLNPQMIIPLAKDVNVTFDNAVFDNYWKFTATEAGTYKITNKAPEGTILRIGELVEGEDKDGKAIFTCDFDTNKKEVTVGSDSLGTIEVELTANKTITVWSETFTRFVDNTRPSILVEKKSENSISNPKTNASKDIVITPNPSNGKFAVKSYLLTEGANINIYDMSGNAIYRAIAAPTNGEFPVQLDNIQPGTYLVLVIGKSKSASTKITIE